MSKRMVTFKKILFSTLLFSLVYNFAAAENGIGKILDTQEDGRIVVNSDCEVTITFRINVANWDPTQPVDMAPMFLIYEIPGALGANYAPIDPAEFAYYQQTIFGSPIYEWRLPVTVNLEDYFNNGGGPVLNYKLRLATAPIGGFITSLNQFYDFPVYYFTEPNQFFSCQAFDLSFGQENDPPGCDISLPFPYATQQVGALEILQNLCVGSEFAGSGSTLQAPPVKEAQSRSAELDQTSQLSSINFSPNPFSAELIAPVEVLEDTQLTLTVFDAAGKIVHQQNQYLQEGTHQVYLDTQHWPQGLYYAQVKTGNAIQTHRLVKTYMH